MREVISVIVFVAVLTLLAVYGTTEVVGRVETVISDALKLQGER